MRVGVVILAAGESRRGPGKLSWSLCGRPLIEWPMKAALSLRAFKRVIVVGSPLSLEALSTVPWVLDSFTVVFNPRYAEGIASSIKAGVKSLEGCVDYYLFMHGDMPFVTVDLLERLVKKVLDDGLEAAYTRHGDRPGPPAVFTRSIERLIRFLEGDRGAAALRGLLKHGYVNPGNPLELIDIDTVEDLERANTLCRTLRQD